MVITTMRLSRYTLVSPCQLTTNNVLLPGRYSVDATDGPVQRREIGGFK